VVINWIGNKGARKKKTGGGGEEKEAGKNPRAI